MFLLDINMPVEAATPQMSLRSNTEKNKVTAGPSALVRLYHSCTSFQETFKRLAMWEWIIHPNLCSSIQLTLMPALHSVCYFHCTGRCRTCNRESALRYVAIQAFSPTPRGWMVTYVRNSSNFMLLKGVNWLKLYFHLVFTEFMFARARDKKDHGPNSQLA